MDTQNDTTQPASQTTQVSEDESTINESTQAAEEQGSTDAVVVDAEVVDGDVPAQTDPTTIDSTNVILDLENMIKTNMTTIDSRRNELKKHKEMLSDILGNDPGYKEASEKAKEANKVKSAAKAQVMRAPNAMALSEKVKGLTAEIKESEDALSDYLREYERLSGSNEIEGDDGEVREIVYVARLVKKSSIYQR